MLEFTSFAWPQTVLAAAISIAATLAALMAGHAVLVRLARGSPTLGAVLRRCEWPARTVLPLMATQLVWHAAPDDLFGIDRVQHANGVLLIAAVTWMLVCAVRGVGEGVIASHPFETGIDNLRARRINTQAKVLARTVMVVVLMAGGSMILMTFPGARQIGASLLASAGVAGLVIGIAARPLFSNLMAGLQIALAQPLRIDDVLIVKGEWGRVEEITGTYVVLRIWDQRRLIIPLQWFIENPFENWTRASADLIGTVFLRVDFRTPLEPLRTEARRLCESSKDWDGRLCLLQVTDAGEHTMELRVLVTASDSGKAFDLRCHVREGLIELLQRAYPQHLPVMRAQVESSIQARRVITGVLDPAHTAVDARRHEAAAQGLAHQQVIDPEPCVARPAIAAVVPEGVEIRFGVQAPQRVGPALLQESREGGARLGLEQGVLQPGGGVVNVGIGRHHIEIARQDHWVA